MQNADRVCEGLVASVALACVSGLLASSPALAQISGLPSIPGIAPLPTAPESPAEMKGVQGPTGVLERVRPEVEAVPFTVKGIDLYSFHVRSRDFRQQYLCGAVKCRRGFPSPVTARFAWG